MSLFAAKELRKSNSFSSNTNKENVSENTGLETGKLFFIQFLFMQFYVNYCIFCKLFEMFNMLFIFTEKISKKSISHSYSNHKTHEKNFDENTESESGNFF